MTAYGATVLIVTAVAVVLGLWAAFGLLGDTLRERDRG